MTKKLKAIFFLNGSSFSFFTQGGTNVFSGTFPPEAVKNLEVIDRLKVTETLKTFFTTNAIGPSASVLVIGEQLLFTKDVPFVTQPLPTAQPSQPASQPTSSSPQNPSSQQQTKEIKKPVLTPQEVAARKEKEALETQRFLDNVPLENVVHKVVPIENGIRLIVTNADFIESLQHAVFSLGSLIESAVPITAFANLPQGEFTREKAQQLLLKVDEAKQQNFLEVPKVKVTHAPDGVVHHEAPQKQHNMRLFAMLGVFGVLMIVTVIMFVLMMQENAKTLQPKVTPTPVVVPSTPTPIAEASQSATFSQSTRVRVIHNTSAQQQLTSVTADLQQLGIRQIETQAVATTGARVAFSSEIPQVARDQIVTIVRKYFTALTTTESGDAAYDIIISF